MSKNDMINHPPHYKLGDHEVIELTQELDFLSGNIVKYVCRAGRKENIPALQDLLKAQWYLDRAIKRYETDKVDIEDCVPTAFARDAELALEANSVDTKNVVWYTDMLFVEDGRLVYNIDTNPEDPDNPMYEGGSIPWPDETTLKLLRAQRDLKYINAERAELVDTLRRLSAQIEKEANN